jgi:hypothetical protein
MALPKGFMVRSLLNCRTASLKRWLALGVGRRRQRIRPLEVGTLLAADFFDRHHAAHGIAVAQRLHELALCIGGRGDDQPAAGLAHGLDRLESDRIEKLGGRHAAAVTAGDVVSATP